MALSDLNVLFAQRGHFGSAKAATEQDGDHGDVSNTSHTLPAGYLEQRSGLIAVEPIASAETQLLYTFDPPNPSGEFGTEQT